MSMVSYDDNKRHCHVMNNIPRLSKSINNENSRK